MADDVEMQIKKKALADPLRQRLLLQFYSPRDWTAKELGEVLGAQTNGLYYHLKILVEAGFVSVVGTQASGRMVERLYRGTNPGQKITWDIQHQPVEFAQHLGNLLEVAKADVQDAIYETASNMEQGTERVLAWVESPAFNTSPDEIDEFRLRLKGLVQEFRERAKADAADSVPDGWKRLNFTYALRERPLAPPEPAREQLATA